MSKIDWRRAKKIGPTTLKYDDGHVLNNGVTVRHTRDDEMGRKWLEKRAGTKVVAPAPKEKQPRQRKG